MHMHPLTEEREMNSESIVFALTTQGFVFQGIEFTSGDKSETFYLNYTFERQTVYSNIS